MNMRLPLLALVLAAASFTASAQDKVLNLYSARHYQTDEALYADFTRQTGIRINRIEGKEEELMERIRNEGANSPADVFITVDAFNIHSGFNLYSVLTIKVHKKSFGTSFSFIITGSYTNRINISPIILYLRVSNRVAVNFAS